MAYQKFEQNDWRGGVVTNVTNESINDEELVDLVNFDYDSRGRLSRRLGYENVLDSDVVFQGNLQGIFSFIGKAYVVDDIANLYDFDKHQAPLFDYPNNEIELICVDGQIKVYSENMSLGDNYNYSKENQPLAIESYNDNETISQSLIYDDSGDETWFTNNPSYVFALLWSNGITNRIQTTIRGVIPAGTEVRDIGLNLLYTTVGDVYGEVSVHQMNTQMSSNVNSGNFEKSHISYNNVFDLGAIDGYKRLSTLNEKITLSGDSNDYIVEIYYKNVGTNKDVTYKDDFYINGVNIERWIKVTENTIVIHDEKLNDIIVDALLESDNTKKYTMSYNNFVNNDTIINFSFNDTNSLLLIQVKDKINVNGEDDIVSHNVGVSLTNVSYITNPTIDFTQEYVATSYEKDFELMVLKTNSIHTYMEEVYQALEITPSVKGSNYKDIVYPLQGTNASFSTIDGVTYIEASQLNESIYITTGKKFIEGRFVVCNDGGTNKMYFVINEVDQIGYIPTMQENLVGGINLIRDYDLFVNVDILNTFENSVNAIVLSNQYGKTSKYNKVKIGMNFASSYDETFFSYRWKLKKQNEDVYQYVEDLSYVKVVSLDALGRTINLSIDEPSIYDIEVEVMDKDGEVLNGYLFGYEVKSYEIEKQDFSDIRKEINSCKRIIQYHGKLILYDNGTSNIYKSFSTYPTWFTVSGVINFNNTEREPLTSLVPLNNTLLGFTKKTISALVGKGDDIELEGYPYEPFSKFVNIDNQIGCVAPRSIAKYNGVVFFLSNDGIKMISNISLDSEVSNIKGIDEKIKNVVKLSEDACGVVYEDVYYLAYPSDTRIIKLHLLNNQFSFDESSELTFGKMWVDETNMYALTSSGKLMKRKKIPYTGTKIDDATLSNQGYFKDDGVIYKSIFETKYNGFGYDANLKKVMQVMVGFNSLRDDIVKFTMDVIVDNTNILDSVQKRFILERDENSEYFTYAEGTNANIVGQYQSDGYSTIGQFLLDKTRVSFVRQTFRFIVFERTVEGFLVKMKITHEQDNMFVLNKLALKYDVGFIPHSFTGHNR